MGANDKGSSTVSGSRQLGHVYIPQKWAEITETRVLPNDAVRYHYLSCNINVAVDSFQSKINRLHMVGSFFYLFI